MRKKRVFFYLLAYLICLSLWSNKLTASTESTYITCHGKSYLTGKTFWFWAIDAFNENNYLKIAGKWKKDKSKNIFIADEVVNHEFVYDNCRYTFRYHKEGAFRDYKLVKVYASKHFYSKNNEIKFDLDSEYPDGLPGDWYEDLPIIKFKRSHLQNFFIKFAVLIGEVSVKYVSSSEEMPQHDKLLKSLPSFASIYKLLMANDFSDYKAIILNDVIKKKK